MRPTRAGRACRREKGRDAKREFVELESGHPWEVVRSVRVVKPGAFCETPEDRVEDSAGLMGHTAVGVARTCRQARLNDAVGQARTWGVYTHGSTGIPADPNRKFNVSHSDSSAFLHADRVVDGDSNSAVRAFPEWDRRHDTPILHRIRPEMLIGATATTQGPAFAPTSSDFRPMRLDLEAETSSMVLSHRVTLLKQTRGRSPNIPRRRIQTHSQGRPFVSPPKGEGLSAVGGVGI